MRYLLCALLAIAMTGCQSSKPKVDVEFSTPITWTGTIIPLSGHCEEYGDIKAGFTAEPIVSSWNTLGDLSGAETVTFWRVHRDKVEICSAVIQQKWRDEGK